MLHLYIFRNIEAGDNQMCRRGLCPGNLRAWGQTSYRRNKQGFQEDERNEERLILNFIMDTTLINQALHYFVGLTLTALEIRMKGSS